MRILIYGINFHPEPTGTGKYTGEMARWLAGRGHEVRVVTAQPSYPHWRVFPGYSAWKYSRQRFDLQDDNKKISSVQYAQCSIIDVFRSPIWVPHKPNGAKRLFHLASFGLSSVPTIMRQVRWSPDIVLVVEPTLFCAPQALLVARWSGAKAWLHIQDFEVDAAFGLGDLSSSHLRDWALAVECRILSAFDRVSTISERMVDRLGAKGVDPARSVLFPNWVDTGEIYPLAGPSPFRKELGITDSTVVALYAGSMGKKHGLHLLAEAAHRLSSCPGLRFVFCGKGPEEQAFVDSVKGLANVSLLPVQPPERLNDLLNLADIHLLPQLSDAADLLMPSKLTGMMASGRAIVATVHAGTQLFKVLEGRGIITPPLDVDAFASALLRVVAEPSIRKQLGQEARRYAVSHLNRDEILLRFERTMLDACGITPLGGETRPCAMQREHLPVEEKAITVGDIAND